MTTGSVAAFLGLVSASPISLWLINRFYNPAGVARQSFPPNDSWIENNYFQQQYYKYTETQRVDLEIPLGRKELRVDEVVRATVAGDTRLARLRKTSFTEGDPLKIGEKVGEFEVLYRDPSQAVIRKKAPFLSLTETQFSLHKHSHDPLYDTFDWTVLTYPVKPLGALLIIMTFRWQFIQNKRLGKKSRELFEPRVGSAVQ